jgi:hypothetical protein
LCRGLACRDQVVRFDITRHVVGPDGQLVRGTGDDARDAPLASMEHDMRPSGPADRIATYAASGAPVEPRDRASYLARRRTVAGKTVPIVGRCRPDLWLMADLRAQSDQYGGYAAIRGSQ